jgi:uncharacterized membrane protein YebE (DUF533 family)
MSAHRLGRDVFLTLAAIGWADGKLDPDEADAIVRTALEEGLEIEEIEEIERATKAPVDLSTLDLSGLTKADRLFVYAVASWMTRLDGVVDDRELDALGRLGDLLKIPPRPREHADAIAREIVERSDDDRPLRFDLPLLRKTIGERLEEATRLRKLSGSDGGDPHTPGGGLGRDVFLALAAVGWSDGKLDPEEADAIVRTALEEGLDLEEIAEIDRATKEPVDLSIIDRSHLTKADRLFIYAVASWMIRLDGRVDQNERAALDKLGDLLKIPPRPREHADAIVLEIAASSDGDQPARFDLPRLRLTILERLAEAQRLRAKAGEAD